VVRAQVAQQALDPSGGDGAFNVSAAFCFGNDLVHELSLEELQSDADPSPEQAAKIQSDGIACIRANQGND
jgi:hypothetical protein